MKALKITLFIILFLIVALLATPFLFKGKIISLVKEQGNKQLNAVLNFDENIDLSLIKSFPDFSLGIHKLSISGINEFEQDTLFSANSISLTLDLLSVISGNQIRVRSVVIDQPRIYAIVLANGKANWDIVKTDSGAAAASADATPSKFNIKLKKLMINDAYLVYDDREGNMYSKLEHLNYILEGDFTEKLFTMNNKIDIQSLTFGMGGMNYLSNVTASATADIDADMNNFKFVFKQNQCSLNELAFAFNGSFAMPADDMIMDITYEAKQNEFKNFLSLIPALYTKDFKELQSKGKMEFNGFVTGTYNDKIIPAFGLNLNVNGGWFKYPALPSPVENVEVKLSINNADGDLDHTKINLSKLHFELAGDPFDAHLLASNPISDPYVDVAITGKLNLDNIVKIAPMPEGTKVSGLINSDFNAKGRVSAIEQEKYEEFDAGGTIEVKGLHYETKSLPKPFDLREAYLTFTPKIVELKSFDAKIGKSDMQMSGQLSNFFGYYLGKGVLRGDLNFSSSLFDANEFMAKDQSAAANAANDDTASMTVFEIPPQIDFSMNSKIGQLFYTNMEINNFVGNIKVADQKLTFNKVALNTLGSAISITGFYETTNPKKPTLEMNFGISNLDIQKAFKTFNTVKKMAPIAENVMGSFTTQLKMQTSLNEKMQPDYATLFAEGLLSIANAEIKNVKAINKVADLINKPEYKQVRINNAKINYKVENGRVYTQPFNLKLGGQNMSLSGSTGLDQTIDYTGKISIPRKDLGAANTAIDGALAQLNKQAGSNIKLSDVIPIQLSIGGTFSNPTVSTNLNEAAKSEASSLKNKAIEELNKKKQELEDKAKAELAKIQKEAEDKIKAETEKAKLQAEKIKKEAEEKAKYEADKLKREAERKINAENEKFKKEAKEKARKKIPGLLGPF
ncbi:MAG: AsmA-like C-terminal region-containing protein [Bacteroidota bacterium]|nr:AsmA-like C-terminal region-containing protein [Bacteroidota bacterium]